MLGYMYMEDIRIKHRRYMDFREGLIIDSIDHL